jgi:hypothetical protein
MAERRRQVNGKPEETRQIERPLPVLLQNAVERFTAWVSKNKDCPPIMTRDLERLGRPCGIKFGGEHVFVLKTSQTLRRRRFCGRSNRQKGHWITALPAAVKSEFRSIADWLQQVVRRRRHRFPPLFRT